MDKEPERETTGIETVAADAGRMAVEIAINPDLDPAEKRRRIISAINEAEDDPEIRRLRVIRNFRMRFVEDLEHGRRGYSVVQRRHGRAVLKRPVDT